MEILESVLRAFKNTCTLRNTELHFQNPQKQSYSVILSVLNILQHPLTVMTKNRIMFPYVDTVRLDTTDKPDIGRYLVDFVAVVETSHS